MAIVYKLTFPDGSSYIGATVKTLKDRMGPHWQAVARGSQSPLSQKLRQFGEPRQQVLSEWPTRDQALEAESKAIAHLKPCLNVHPGGPPSEDLVGNVHKKGKREGPETRQRKSEAFKGNQNRKGIPHSEAVKSKISASLKGRPKPDETKRRMREAWARKREGVSS